MYNLPYPIKFNPLKHHLSFIRDFVQIKVTRGESSDVKKIAEDLKYLGTSVMDVYTGSLTVDGICTEALSFLDSHNLNDHSFFMKWVGRYYYNYKTVKLSDNSLWMLKYNDDQLKFVHIFPARMSPHSFRIKANTLKSAIIYLIVIGKDYITREDLNSARALIGLSPVKSPEDTEAIIEMIEILRLS